MELKKAKEIISSLAEGFDPVTEEAYSEDSPYCRSDVVSALKVFLDNLDPKERAVKPNLKKGPKSAGEAWSPTEEAMLVAYHESGLNFKEIAREHGRSIGAIKARLSLLGVIDYEWSDSK